MKKVDLLESFIDKLKANTPKRSQLIANIADILKIEKDSAGRRLNGRVQFTAEEMGILANEYGISLDNLIKGENHSLPFELFTPLTQTTFEPGFIRLNKLLNELSNIEESQRETGTVFSFLPLEFCINYPHLAKLFYFKWGHFFIGTDEYFHFTEWELPEKITTYLDNIKEAYKKYESIFYIWENQVIWNLKNDIEYFYRMHAMNQEDVNLVKQDVHDLLDNIESICREIPGSTESFLPGKMDFYIANIPIGMYYSYHQAENSLFCFYKTDFIESSFIHDLPTCNKIREWIHSMKKVSTLISGSGGIGRRLFFEQQHNIIDMIDVA